MPKSAMERAEEIGKAVAIKYVEMAKVNHETTRGWVCGAVCGGGCGVGCVGGCSGGCILDGPIPVGDVVAAGGATGTTSGVATGLANQQ